MCEYHTPFSICLAFLTLPFSQVPPLQAISWVLIYRTNSYKSLRSSIDKAAKKLETMKTDSSSAAKITKKSKTKKIDRFESSLKESSRDLLLFKFKSGAVVALVLFGLLNSLFEGKAMAKLPFRPFGLVMKMSHRELQGEQEPESTALSLSGVLVDRCLRAQNAEQKHKESRSRRAPHYKFKSLIPNSTKSRI